MKKSSNSSTKVTLTPKNSIFRSFSTILFWQEEFPLELVVRMELVLEMVVVVELVLPVQEEVPVLQGQDLNCWTQSSSASSYS